MAKVYLCDNCGGIIPRSRLSHARHVVIQNLRDYETDTEKESEHQVYVGTKQERDWCADCSETVHRALETVTKVQTP